MRAIRGGHVPGAVNIPFEENWVDPGTPGKLARREVAQQFAACRSSPRPTCAISIRGSTPTRKRSSIAKAACARRRRPGVSGKLGFRNVKVYDFILARLRRQARCPGGE